jgi:hypothetical protein
MQVTGRFTLRDDVAVNKLYLINAQANSARDVFRVEAMIQTEQAAIELVVRNAKEELFLALRQ